MNPSLVPIGPSVTLNLLNDSRNYMASCNVIQGESVYLTEERRGRWVKTLKKKLILPTYAHSLIFKHISQLGMRAGVSALMRFSWRKVISSGEVQKETPWWRDIVYSLEPFHMCRLWSGIYVVDTLGTFFFQLEDNLFFVGPSTSGF